MNKKNKFIILPIIYLVSSALSIVPCLFLQDFQLDALSTKIVNSSQNKNDSDEKKAILNIESMTSGDTFSNLVSYTRVLSGGS